MENSKKGDSISEREIEKRKEKVIHFLKKRTGLIFYGILAIIISISVYIRTLSLSKLKDVTTGTWTLGPDLDPFLFLRWAKYIAENGTLFVLDKLRSIPLAEICSGTACKPVDTSFEMKLLSYMIAWLNNFISIFDPNSSVTFAAVIFPVIMAILTAIAFFLFARKIFYKEDKKIANIIALISTAFFVLIPSLLSRSIAGIPEKESAAFFFIFMAFYLFLEAVTSEKIKRGVICGILAGIMTGLLGLIWGGVTFVFLGISGAVLISFFLGKIGKKELIIYSLWIISSLALMIPFSLRYSFKVLITSSSTGISFLVLFLLLTDFILFKERAFGIGEKIKKKIKLPEPVISLIIMLGLGIIFSSIFLGVSFIQDFAEEIIGYLINPFEQTRFGVTVAENRWPYFVDDWVSEFGPVIFNIPLYFWLFLIGAILIFREMIKKIEKKEGVILILSYIVFLFCLIFSNYSKNSVFNGNSPISYLVYSAGFIILVGTLVRIYYKKYKEGKLEIFKEFDFAYVLYFVILTMMIVAARGAVRLIMLLGAVSPIAVGFLIVISIKGFFKEKEETKKMFLGIIMVLILLSSIFTLWIYYQSDKSVAENYAPGSYQWQWQKAMAWVRDNTAKDSVFAHWWDYGYWVQSIGERATILDGGNAIGYWNHLMGRYVLAGANEDKALEFLYSHNATHFLIDSTDIGKYSAFSSIGSDRDYDLYSWMPVVLLDESQTQETNNKTGYVYPVGSYLDEDVILEEEGKEILLPRGKAAVIAIMIQEGVNGEIFQPIIFYTYNNKQYQSKLRYLYLEGELYDFKTGVESGIYIFLKLTQTSSGQLKMNSNGAGIYLSSRTIHSGIARLYLFNEDSDYFTLAHSEDSEIVKEMKEQGFDSEDFIYYEGLQGPIKIWEVNYPSNLEVNETYLLTDYPDKSVTLVKKEYT